MKKARCSDGEWPDIQIDPLLGTALILAQLANKIDRNEFWWSVFRAAFVVLVVMVLLITNGPIFASPGLLHELYDPTNMRIVTLAVYAVGAMAFLAIHRLSKLN